MVAPSGSVRRMLALGAVVVVAALAVVVSTAAPVRACTCPGYAPGTDPDSIPHEEFRGTVVASETAWEDEGPIHYSGEHHVTMVVDDVVAGSLRKGGRVELALAAGQPSACGFASAPRVGASRYVRVDGVAGRDGTGTAHVRGAICNVHFSDAPLGGPALVPDASSPSPSSSDGGLAWWQVIVILSAVGAALAIITTREPSAP